MHALAFRGQFVQHHRMSDVTQMLNAIEGGSQGRRTKDGAGEAGPEAAPWFRWGSQNMEGGGLTEVVKPQ